LEVSNGQLMCSRTRIGSPYVIAAMQDLAKEPLADKEPSAADKATPAKIVGYEANGGFMVGNDIELNGKILHALPTRDAVLPILIVLSQSYQSGVTISNLLKNLPSRFTASTCIKNIFLSISDEIINSLELDQAKQEAFLFEVYADESLKIITINKTDGLRLTISNNDIIHIRPSGNAPELRVYVETSTMDKSEGLVESVIAASVMSPKVPYDHT
jgi:phosphomannomutase